MAKKIKKVLKKDEPKDDWEDVEESQKAELDFEPDVIEPPKKAKEKSKKSLTKVPGSKRKFL